MSWIAIVLIVIGVWIAIKAAGALLKLGLSEYGLGKVDEAERTLANVIAQYPGSDVARTADDRLKSMQLGRSIR